MGLTTLPAEVLQYLCLFLALDDITALSQTCVLIYHVLNINVVWERFLTGDKKKVGMTLANLEQRLDPPFHPNPDFCENRQHLLRVNHLHTNWRNGRCVSFSAKHKYYKNNYAPETSRFFNENFMLLVFYSIITATFKVSLWDITKRPVEVARRKFSAISISISGEYLVECRFGCRVKVYRVDFKSKLFPLHYSFLTHEDVVTNEDVTQDKCDRCGKWRHMIKGRFLVSYLLYSSERSPHTVLHIWDIVNATKIGAFQPHFQVASEKMGLAIHSVEGCNLVFKSNNVSNLETIFFKFNTETKRFSECVFRRDDVSFTVYDTLMYENYAINILWGGNEITYEVFEFSSSVRLKSKTFHDSSTNGFFPHELLPRKVIDGKLTAVCRDSTKVVDALSLETLTVAPHGCGDGKYCCQISVAGETHVVNLKHDGTLVLSDLSSKLPLELTQNVTSNWNNNLILQDKEEREPFTKLVVYEGEKLTLFHFW